MTCKDCIHYEACKTFNQYIPDETANIDRFCDEFKDKSHFLKLPCKVGDTIYKLWYAPCHNGEIYPDSYGCDGCYDKCDLHKEIFEFEVPSLGFIVNELLKDDNSVYFFFYLRRSKESVRKGEENMSKIIGNIDNISVTDNNGNIREIVCKIDISAFHKRIKDRQRVSQLKKKRKFRAMTIGEHCTVRRTECKDCEYQRGLYYCDYSVLN